MLQRTLNLGILAHVDAVKTTITERLLYAPADALGPLLPALTRGEGVLECDFDRYRPVDRTIPTGPRSDENPLDRRKYLLRVARRG